MYIIVCYDVAVQYTYCCVIRGRLDSPRYRQMKDSEKIRASQLRGDGETYQGIANILSQEAEDGRKFDRATVYRVCRSIPNLPLDQPFEWHRLDEYTLPWEAGGYILDMWREIQKFRVFLHVNYLFDPGRSG